MLKKAREILRTMTREDWFVALFGASFFIGVWYALPMVNTITDVWPFGGGVLRAIEAHTFLPGPDVDYGTLSFYQNYFFMAVVLCVGYVFLGFDIEALKTTLILNPSYSLLVPRIASALTAAVFLVIVYRFLKTCVQSVPWRLTFLMFAFGNVLTVILARSGKMWMLSIALGVISFIYLYRAITEEGNGTPGKLTLISIISAFLATANFAFAGIFLINIPVFLYMFSRTRETLRQLAYMVSAGAGVFLIFFALNAANIIDQVSGFVTQFFNPAASTPKEGTLSLSESFAVNIRQAIEAFPLLLLALIPAVRSGIRDVLLMRLSLLYVAVYIVVLAVVFRTDHGLALNVRHIFPLCFFLMFLLVAFRPPARWVAIFFFVAGFLVYVYTAVLLSIPTTYNAASDFIVHRYGDQKIRIDESLWELTLPTNKASYALYATTSCASTCQHTRTLPYDIAFRPLVVTKDSDPVAVAKLPPPDLIVVERAVKGCEPLARFGNETSDDEVYDIDINLGRMLLLSFYSLHQLGKNIYIYDAKECMGATASVPQ